MGIDLGIGPGGVLEFGGLRGRLSGVKARADEIEDAAEGEVIAHDLGELLRVGFCVVSARAEVGHRQANLFNAEAGACAEPWILSLLCTGGTDY